MTQAGDAVGLKTLLAGFRQAYDRWMVGPRLDPDPEQAFFGIFEALNWAVVIDDRLKATLLGWPSGYDDRGALLGFRYARNAVHHDWAEALWLDQRGFVLPSPLPAPFFEWCWQPSLQSTRTWGVEKYRTHLSGKPVRFTLEALGTLFAKAVADAPADHPHDEQHPCG